jgi:hypothetical protein
VLGLVFLILGGSVSLRNGFLSSSFLNLAGFLTIALVMTDTLRPQARVPFTLKNAHPFAFISFFNKSPMLRKVGLFALISEAPNFQVRSPKLTVAFSQSSYILMTYRVVGARVTRACSSSTSLAG